MKTIDLLSLELKNFKGIKYLKILFNKETTIFGDNGTGKTTIPDSFFWLFSDKDSTDRKDFEIKTLDGNNNIIHGLEHTVIGRVSIDGKIKTFQKTLKEKWQKKRGESEAVFTGNETSYYIDDVPLQQKDYKASINSVIDEMLFKLITNPLYFSQGLKWQERRNILTGFNRHITPELVIGNYPELEPLRPEIESKDIESFKKTLSARKKKLNDDLKTIPSRIDECTLMIKDDVDFNILRAELEVKQSQLFKIETMLSTPAPVDNTYKEKLNAITTLRNKISKIENDFNAKKQEEESQQTKLIAGLERDLKDKNSKLEDEQRELKRLNSDLEHYEKLTKSYREQWQTEKEKQLEFTEQFICPTCKRLFDAEVIEAKKAEMTANFNENKAKNLQSITSKGKEAADKATSIKEKIAGLDSVIKDLENKIISISKSISTEKSKLESLKNEGTVFEYGVDYYNIKDELEALNNSITAPANVEDDTKALREQKQTLTREIDNLKAQLLYEETNKIHARRIGGLKLKERETSQQIADAEKMEFLCEKYLRAEMELLEGVINAEFGMVKFKLFSQNINGGIEPCCETLINGVPFTDANTGSKINAGLDIINTLSKKYGVSAPVFIDNAESITKYRNTDSQLIKLVVKENQKVLLVN